MTSPDDQAKLRRYVYVLLITVTVGMAAGRILAVERVYEPTLYKADENDATRRGNWPSSRPPALPTFSSNDRSRWAMIRALVDHGTFVIGERNQGERGPQDYLSRHAATLLSASGPFEATTLVIASRQQRIDTTYVVWDKNDWPGGWDTVDKALNPVTQQFYSTKPPLLPILVAGLYWLLQLLTGWTLADNVWEVVKTTLLLINVLPFAVYLWLVGCLVDRFARNDWSRIYIMSAACFATLVTPFLITFNNHTPAAFSVLFALYPALLILRGNQLGEKQGDAAPRHLFLLAGLFASFAACNELPALAFTAGLGLILLIRAPRRTLLYFAPAAALPIAAFLVTNYIAVGGWQPIYTKFGTIWYEFEGSHWAYPPDTPRGIDYARGQETIREYIFHVLIGHHGLFSLTPMWLLAFVGMNVGMIPVQSSDNATGGARREAARLPWYFFAASLLLSLIIIGFYLVKSDNYGGWTSGLRWLMWLTPVWLLCLIPVLDRLVNFRVGRWFAYLFLALSVLSVSFPAWNPWRHPWIYRWMDVQGWIPY